MVKISSDILHTSTELEQITSIIILKKKGSDVYLRIRSSDEFISTKTKFAQQSFLETIHAKFMCTLNIMKGTTYFLAFLNKNVLPSFLCSTHLLL
jgi:hypothetical protein